MQRSLVLIFSLCLYISSKLLSHSNVYLQSKEKTFFKIKRNWRIKKLLKQLHNQVLIEHIDLIHPFLVRSEPRHVELDELDGSLAELLGPVEITKGQQLHHVLPAQLLLLRKILETRHLVLVA